MTRWRIVAAIAAAGCLASAQHRDPDELVRLQTVLRAAVQRVGPSIVRVETFGGARRVLAGTYSDPDRVGSETMPRLSDAAWEELFEDLDRARLRTLFPDVPVDQLDRLGPNDLRALAPREVRRLLDEFRREHGRPPGRRPDRPQRGPLVQPGFIQAQGATTGLIVSPDGWIVVSRFALSFDPSTILITLADGRSFTAVRHGEDTSRGIALVKIDAADLPVPELAPPAGVRVGQWAFALGRAFGGDQPSVHMGIVSATDRLFRRATQIDAATSPANYGGPVIDVRGRVLGVCAPLSPSGRDSGADWYDSGIGFATTLHGIEPLLERLQRGEVLNRAWLGVVADASHLGPGARILSTADDGPASALGIGEGDVITAVDGEQIRNGFHLQIAIGARLAGEAIELAIRRGERRSTVSVTLGAVPVSEREARTKRDETFTPPWEEGDPDKR